MQLTTKSTLLWTLDTRTNGTRTHYKFVLHIYYTFIKIIKHEAANSLPRLHKSQKPQISQKREHIWYDSIVITLKNLKDLGLIIQVYYFVFFVAPFARILNKPIRLSE